MSKEDLLFEIADRQQGYFTAEQARECDYYDSHFQRCISSREWTKVGRGLYRLSRYPVTDRPDLVEWSLWSRNKKGKIQGVWSHETALDLYELCDVMPAKLHMTVPKRFRKSIALPHVLRIYFTDLQESDWVEQQGYRVTTPIRTLLDLAGTRQISDEFLEQAVREGKNKGILTQQNIDSLPTNPAGYLLRHFYDQKQ
jgi:predicted transcriptional regulator of viral defense system